MKKRISIVPAVAFILWSILLLSPAYAAEDTAPSPEFRIGRLVVCEGVENLEPVGENDIFPGSLDRVYAFLEALDIAGDTTVTFVWYFGENEMARVVLALRKGPRWRTYSSKKLGGLKGDWKVDLLDAEGNLVRSIQFRVE